MAREPEGRIGAVSLSRRAKCSVDGHPAELKGQVDLRPDAVCDQARGHAKSGAAAGADRFPGLGVAALACPTARLELAPRI